MKPFVKWAGGKRQIIKLINPFIDDSVKGFESYTYIEPFVGGGAVFFDRKPKNAIINDLNEDLINAYKVIQSDKYESLIKLLREHDLQYRLDPDGYYYDVRGWDRYDGWTHEDEVKKAARMIFLNRTCYNGLYRVNNKGLFNTPIGRYKNPTICDTENIIEIHDYLSSKYNNIEILCGPYEYALRKAKDNDVVYLDPPYDYEDDDGFTKYQMEGFTFNNFVEMKQICDEIISNGPSVIITNNATTKVINLFEQDANYKVYYNINKFNTLRSINCKGNGRRTGLEAIFWGISTNIPFPQANDINKIIKLMTSNFDILKDIENAKKILNVETSRQVAYYFSALKFFKYITSKNEFSEDAKKIRGNENEIVKDIFIKLYKNPLFRHFYDLNNKKYLLSQDEIAHYMKEKYFKGLSYSTLVRRASTIKSWVEWMSMVKLEKEIGQIL